jgi:MFS family permease
MSAPAAPPQSPFRPGRTFKASFDVTQQVDERQEQVPEDPDAINVEQRRRWLALFFANVVLFVSESSRGLFLPTLLDYFISLSNPTEGLAMVSYAVSAFSIGRLIAAPIFGWLTDRFSAKNTFYIVFILSAVGHFLYAGSKTALVAIAARALVPLLFYAPVPRAFKLLNTHLFFTVVGLPQVGFGSGSLSVCRAVVVGFTTVGEERTRQLSILSTSKFFGYAVVRFFLSLITLQFSIASTFPRM